MLSEMHTAEGVYDSFAFRGRFLVSNASGVRDGFASIVAQDSAEIIHVYDISYLSRSTTTKKIELLAKGRSVSFGWHSGEDFLDGYPCHSDTRPY